MSKRRNGRYGWTRERWLAYKAWAMSFVAFIHNANTTVAAAIDEMMDRRD